MLLSFTVAGVLRALTKNGRTTALHSTEDGTSYTRQTRKSDNMAIEQAIALNTRKAWME
jgi:hypothetical protein